MISAREEMLARVRAALSDVPAGERAQHVAVPRRYRREGELGAAERLERFTQRVADYRATVHRLAAEPELPALLARVLAAEQVVLPPGLPAPWVPEGLSVVPDRELTHAQLDAADGVLSGCAVAVAETGTIVLDSGPTCGRRALTLLPDHHVCVVLGAQVVETVPEALARLGEAVRAGRPVTFVSGPSATSDIELSRVEGVHGPRRLDVVLVG